MRKLITLLLLSVSISIQAQNVPDLIRTTPVPATGANKNNRATVDANLKAAASLNIPRYPTNTLNGAKDSSGYVMLNTTLNRFVVYRGGGVWDTYATLADLANSGVSSFNGRTGVVNLTSTDINTALGFTPENVANKTNTISNSTTLYPSVKAVQDYVASNKSINTTVAGLRLITAPTTDVLYQTTDFGGGNWYYDATDATSTDNTANTIVSTNGKRFKKLVKFVYVDDFGAIGNGVTNDATAIQAAYDYANSIGGSTVVYTSGKTYGISSSITIKLNAKTDFRGATVKALSSMGAMFLTGTTDFHQFNSITGQNAKLDGNGLATHGIWLKLSADCRISNIYIENTTTAYIQVGNAAGSNSYGVRINNVYGDRQRPTATPASSYGIYLVNLTDSYVSNTTVISATTGFYCETTTASIYFTDCHAWARLPESSMDVCWDLRGNTYFLNQCYFDTFLVTGLKATGSRIKLSQCGFFNNSLGTAGLAAITISGSAQFITTDQCNFVADASKPFAKDLESGAINLSFAGVTMTNSSWANCPIQTSIENNVVLTNAAFGTGKFYSGVVTGSTASDFMSGMHMRTRFSGTFGFGVDLDSQNGISVDRANTTGYAFHSATNNLPTAVTSKIHSDASNNIAFNIGGSDVQTIKAGTTETTNNISIQPTGAIGGSSTIFFQTSRGQVGWDGTLGGLLFKTSDNSKPFSFKFGTTEALGITSTGVNVSGALNGTTGAFSGNVTAAAATTASQVVIKSQLDVKQNQKIVIASWGDSLTQGTGASAGNTYPELLALETGFEFFNGGVAGETSTQIKTRLLAASVVNKQAVIIWAGRNNYPDPTTVKADIAAMVANLAGRPFVIVSILNGEYVSERAGGADYITLTTLNNDLQALYPNNYVDLRKFLVNLYNPSVPADVSDFAFDIVPSTLRSDQIHLNDLGYRKAADFLKRQIDKVMGDGTLMPNNVETNGIRITGNNLPSPLYGLGIEQYFTSSQGYIGAYNRTASVPLPLNLQSYAGAVLNLTPLGGTINVGGDVVLPSKPYSTGTYRPLVRNVTTGKMEDVATTAPTLQAVATAGASSTVPIVINPTVNSDFALNVSNTGTTNAHGVYVNIGASSTGIILRADKNGVEKFSVNNDGSVKVATAPVSATDVVRFTDIQGGYVPYTGATSDLNLLGSNKGLYTQFILAEHTSATGSGMWAGEFQNLSPTGHGITITAGTSAFSAIDVIPYTGGSPTYFVTGSGDVTSKSYRVSAMNTAPASATSTGIAGEIRITATFIYVCTATNTWVRSALSTW